MKTLTHHFGNDGQSSVPLSPSQGEAKRRFEDKVRQGHYRYVPTRCLCGSGESEAIGISEKDRYGLAVRVWMCRRCSLLYTSPYFDDPSAIKFYAEDYRDIYDGGAASLEQFFQSQFQTGRQLTAWIAQWGITLQNLRVLDIGCGAGGILKAFQEKGATCTGCDLDPRYVGYGKAKGLDLRLSDFASIDLPANHFGLILISHVLEHFPQPQAILATAKRLLKDTGHLFIEVPNVTPRLPLMAQLQNAHVWYFDLPTLKDLLSATGFRVQHVATPYHLRTLSCIQSSPAAESVSHRTGQIKWLAIFLLETVRSLRFRVARRLEEIGLKKRAA